MIASILGTEWKVFKSPGNRNQPKAIRKHAGLITPYHEAIVLEFGMARKRQIRQSCSIIQPNIAVITMVGIAQNYGNLGSMKMVIDCTNDLLRYMKSTWPIPDLSDTQ
jgi:UDP-N-acetylmuramoyl-tripeptide--D-alanyl-D-alanine ligase